MGANVQIFQIPLDTDAIFMDISNKFKIIDIDAALTAIE